MPYKTVTLQKLVSTDTDKPSFMVEDDKFTIELGDTMMSLTREDALALGRFIERTIGQSFFMPYYPADKSSRKSCYALEA